MLNDVIRVQVPLPVFIKNSLMENLVYGGAEALSVWNTLQT